MPKIGAHVSSAISLENSFKKALEIGAEAIQIFISPPQQWAYVDHDQNEIERFKKAADDTNIGPNFIHGSYLINLGSTNPEHLQKSIEWLVYALNLAEKLGIKGIIFHTGSHKGRDFKEVVPQVAKALKKILEYTSHFEQPNNNNNYSLKTESEEAIRNLPYLILETSAGSGSTIGDTFEELGQILKEVRNISTSLSADRLKICLDTQHVFAAGYDIKSKQKLNQVLEEFDKQVGLENLITIHANDSMTEFKSKRDRHANIGEGFIGLDGFKNIINHPKLKEMTFILEVPGIERSGPDKENIQKLKSLII